MRARDEPKERLRRRLLKLVIGEKHYVEQRVQPLQPRVHYIGKIFLTDTAFESFKVSIRPVGFLQF